MTRQENGIELHQPHDPRTQRTCQSLQEALFQLIIEQGYEIITIAAITERAGLGRTTFYLHYRDKDELLHESSKELIHRMALDVEPDGEGTVSCAEHSVYIFQHVARNQSVYQALLREQGPANIGDSMRSYFIDLCQRVILRDLLSRGILSPLSGELIAAYAAGALFGLISWWFVHQFSPSAEEMGAFLWQLMEKAVTGYIVSPTLDTRKVII
jgi:AcrR family transcriptional regulator